jgi:DUF971 family protein
MAAPEHTPVSLDAPMGQPWLSIEWADGFSQKIPALILRGYCPCAGCQGHGGTIEFTSGHDCELRDIQTVGNYALSITWGDGHSAGIYSFDFLRSLSDLYAQYGDELPQRHPVYPGGSQPTAAR